MRAEAEAQGLRLGLGLGLGLLRKIRGRRQKRLQEQRQTQEPVRTLMPRKGHWQQTLALHRSKHGQRRGRAQHLPCAHPTNRSRMGRGAPEKWGG